MLFKSYHLLPFSFPHLEVFFVLITNARKCEKNPKFIRYLWILKKKKLMSIGICQILEVKKKHDRQQRVPKLNDYVCHTSWDILQVFNYICAHTLLSRVILYVSCVYDVARKQVVAAATNLLDAAMNLPDAPPAVFIFVNGIVFTSMDAPCTRIIYTRRAMPKSLTHARTHIFCKAERVGDAFPTAFTCR